MSYFSTISTFGGAVGPSVRLVSASDNARQATSIFDISLSIQVQWNSKWQKRVVRHSSLCTTSVTTIASFGNGLNPEGPERSKPSKGKEKVGRDSSSLRIKLSMKAICPGGIVL